MNISISGQTLHVDDILDLGAACAPAVRDQVRAAITPDIKMVELDLSKTRYIDSTGLGALIAIHKSVIGSEGQLVIVNATSTVTQILELTRLYKVFALVRR